MKSKEDFKSWYAARRKREPFPWMERLAALFAEDRLPTAITLPTGTGKSEVVMIWAWARQQNENLPRRLWIASDRRVIVDQSYDTAKDGLKSDDVLVTRLRGGIAMDQEPMLDPVRMQVISTTVDQLGSRLLFRGYGVAPRAWPIHAALVGTDSLVILDEAHLSPNAEDVLQSCIRLGADARLISMTATPRDDSATFALDDDDRAHPILGPRLAARRLVEPWKSDDLLTACHDLLSKECRRVALVANTVAAAREAFDRVSAAVSSTSDGADVYLLTGRQRPLDRDAILDGLLPRIKSGAETPERPIVVVTTQAIEAGADLDFDGMASQGCPIDSLLQRIGRLDRLGSGGNSRCILLRPDRKFEAPYGAAPHATWSWIDARAEKPGKKESKVLDLGPVCWSKLSVEVTQDMRAGGYEPVSLLAPHLRMLSWTSPRPSVEPDIGLLLHGAERAGGAVAVVWRRDLQAGDDQAIDVVRPVLQKLPPSALEACPVPIRELRDWLSGHPSSYDTGDLEGAIAPDERRDRKAEEQSQRVLRWLGRDDPPEPIEPDKLRPGDVIILPSELGGYDAHGWNPNCSEPVPDLAELAFEKRTGRTIVRFERPDIDDGEIEAALRDSGIDVAQERRVHRWDRGTFVEVVPRNMVVGNPHREVLLSDHQEHVAAHAASWARELNLNEDILRLAGLHHDDGKADLRWQIAIRTGDITRLSEPPLAKGRFLRTALDRLPLGWRHEAESVALLQKTKAVDHLCEEERQLVLWLVATHHGHARPLWGGIDGARNHGLGFAEAQDRLQELYGPWKLALHEAVLRLSDQRVSRTESEGPDWGSS